MAKNLQAGSLHISKLTEAAWIQDCRTAKARHEKTLSLFEDYCSEVSEIIQLRYFQSTTKYELIGIPVDLFKGVLALPSTEFASEGPSIKIPVGKIPPNFTLKLDRSDAKITIAQILLANCTIYGEWTIGTGR
jgi:hypothetical protein